ncbi:hypothetical protein BTA51_10425 [Hahella sp. CCB-MM4]|uniref:glycosyltransferase family 2 protein n=1 Tax=Hahella sp. (strain CCB-MM4) TaxID=1926491 RepID=UPI000B9A48AB|nr:glycosyltransferase family 2 protein [Hahella sp. CCB-MM4]OZG73432.1 hypothetical protein BTA51_10425 [Hahella sp. CCB-MM4]
MTDSNPLVSVIVPVYNRLDFLPQLFNTIFSQDYDNYEVIIVDDGSTDGTVEWIEQHRDQFPKPILLLKQANAGHYDARNNGLDHARGELIAFQDSDDEWTPYHISQLTRLLVNNPDVDWVFGKIQRIDHITGEIVEASNMLTKSGEPHPFLSLNKENREGGLKVFKDPRAGEFAIRHRVPGSTQCAMMRKKIYSSLRFDPSYRTAYDQFFAVRVVLAGFTFAYVEELQQIYHVHDSHISLVAGGDPEKRERSARTHIRGYSSLIPYVSTRGEKAALREKLAHEWAWSLSISLRDQKRHKEEALSLWRAVLLEKTNLSYWKTFFSAIVRTAVTRTQNSAA